MEKKVSNTEVMNKVKNYISQMIDDLEWNIDDGFATATATAEVEDGFNLTLTAEVFFEAYESSDKEECWGRIYTAPYTVVTGCSCNSLSLEVETEDEYEYINLLEEYGEDVANAFRDEMQN